MKFIKKYSQHTAPGAWLGAIVAAYTALVLGNSTRWSIWFDEAFGAYLMRYSFSDLTAYTAADVHPPLYYWLLKAWVSIFSTSELAFRSLSLVMGIAAIILLFVLVRRLFRSTEWALVASACMALSPLVVRFGHEARMYTLVVAIVLAATYVLVRANEKNAPKFWWALYGILLAAGMLTQYFTALAWIAHWVWRYGEKRAGRLKSFWTREWIWSHVLAIGLFAWWIPAAIRQVIHVQSGFWIPAVSAYTPVDYVSNALLYRQYGEVHGWWAVLFFAAIAAMAYLLRRGYPIVRRRSAAGVQLLAALALVPPFVLALVSLPPLRSTFMDRYVLYSQAIGLALVGICFAALFAVKPTRRLKLLAAGIATVLLVGIGNVYYFGNYNKNSGTSIRVKETITAIAKAGNPGQPIIAASPWIYYEASFYESDYHPVYFLDSQADDYRFGSLDMLRDNQVNKIIDLATFTDTYRYVWYLGNRLEGELQPPVAGWQQVQSVEAFDYIDGNVKYRASLFDTNPSAE